MVLLLPFFRIIGMTRWFYLSVDISFPFFQSLSTSQCSWQFSFVDKERVDHFGLAIILWSLLAIIIRYSLHLWSLLCIQYSFCGRANLCSDLGFGSWWLFIPVMQSGTIHQLVSCEVLNVMGMDVSQKPAVQKCSKHLVISLTHSVHV